MYSPFSACVSSDIANSTTSRPNGPVRCTLPFLNTLKQIQRMPRSVDSRMRTHRALRKRVEPELPKKKKKTFTAAGGIGKVGLSNLTERFASARLKGVHRRRGDTNCP